MLKNQQRAAKNVKLANPNVTVTAGAVTISSGTVAATQSGTWNVTNVSGTVSLPTGAATAALQTQPGVDIGDVTINNASGGSAVNIQDGGNSITVDGSVTCDTELAAATTVVDSKTLTTTSYVIAANYGFNGVGWDRCRTSTANGLEVDVTRVQGTVASTQSGTWNVTNVSGTVSLPTGAATAALQTQPGVDIGDVTVNNASGAAAVNIQDGGNSITVDQATAASFNAQVVGEVAHDSGDSGNPVKVGGKATDWEPDTDAEQGPTDVTANDRVQASLHLNGTTVETPQARWHAWDNISTTYNNTTTTATSTAIEVWKYRQATLSYEIDSTNAPTDIRFRVQVSCDGTNYADLTNDALSSLLYDDVVTGTLLAEAYTFPVAAHSMRVRVDATGTTASATFAVTNALIYLRN